MCINEYASHNDQHKADIRRIAAAHNADRARMLATEQERDLGCITLYMSKHELQQRLNGARWQWARSMARDVLTRR
jgi:hypothetical protein